MKRGYKILWTDHALDELSRTFQYLQLNFSEKETDHLAEKIESIIGYISKYLKLYPEFVQKSGVRRAVITKFNILYYRVNVEANQLRYCLSFRPVTIQTN